jgi:sigma-B regulation protein RsbU (phosphoserine phosphatase)
VPFAPTRVTTYDLIDARQHSIALGPGNVLVVYSDGLVEACPDLELDWPKMAAHVDGSASAPEIVNRLVSLADLSGAPPDDLTVVVLRGRDDA